MQLEFGNAASLDTNGTGWFIGFSEWAKANVPGVPELRHMPRELRSHTLAMKWMSHAPGEPRGSVAPISEGRTISMLVSATGPFRLRFCPHEDFARGGVVEHVLARHGDFSIWGEGVYHDWIAEGASTILTLRWIPESRGR